MAKQKRREATAERQRLAILGGAPPETPAQAIAAAWRWRAWLARNPHVKPSPRLQQFQAMVTDLTTAFIHRAMAEWQPEMLKELAREMKRGGIPEKWQPDKAAWCLLEASRQGNVNLTKVQEVTQQRHMLTQHIRTWRRKAHKLGLPIREPGAPKK